MFSIVEVSHVINAFYCLIACFLIYDILQMYHLFQYLIKTTWPPLNIFFAWITWWFEFSGGQRSHLAKVKVSLPESSSNLLIIRLSEPKWNSGGRTCYQNEWLPNILPVALLYTGVWVDTWTSRARKTLWKKLYCHCDIQPRELKATATNRTSGKPCAMQSLMALKTSTTQNW